MRPVSLTPSDLAGALRLSTEAGWNQTERDWGIFVTHGNGFGIREGNALVATVATLPYAGFGYLAMLLTTESHRHCGFATSLLTRAMRVLGDAEVTPMLDATPAGRPVYLRRGFLPVDVLERWEGAAGVASAPASAPLDALADLDATAFGVRREFLLADFLARPGSVAIVGEDGCVVARPGRRAARIGPLIAGRESQAILLLRAALEQVSGPVLLDVPTRWTGLADWLGRHGFSRRQGYTRMAFGDSDPPGDPARLFAVAGPEFG